VAFVSPWWRQEDHVRARTPMAIAKVEEGGRREKEAAGGVVGFHRSSRLWSSNKILPRHATVGQGSLDYDGTSRGGRRRVKKK
jgi:hypothetical protein